MNGWKIVEDINAAATFAAGQPPVLFRTRISDHQMDDVMVLNGSTGQLVVVQHPDVPQGATTFAPAVLSTRPYSGNPLAAIPARTNIDGRHGIVSIHQGESTPSVLMPLPDPTFTVNTTADTVTPGACAAATAGQCSLREAIIEANATAGTDTIIVPTGTVHAHPAQKCGGPPHVTTGNAGSAGFGQHRGRRAGHDDYPRRNEPGHQRGQGDLVQPGH